MLNVASDGDRDHDGVFDSRDGLPDDPNEQFDTDRDLIGNKADPDDDNDGMPDDYEIANGFDPLSATSASGDEDLDGFTNLEEFKAGTNPLDASSIPLDASSIPLNASSNPDTTLPPDATSSSGSGGGSLTSWHLFALMMAAMAGRTTSKLRQKRSI